MEVSVLTASQIKILCKNLGKNRSVQIKLKCVGCEEISMDNFSVYTFYIIFC